MGRSNSVDVFLRLHGQRKFSKELAASGAELEAMGLKGATSIASFAAASSKLKKFGSSWTRHVTLPVTLGAGLAAKAAIDWESAFAGVRKTVNATEKQYASMEKGIRSMSLHIPVAANDLAGIAEAAGQLGIKRKAILGFTRVIADLGVATNLAGDEGATTLARFANITQMPQSQFDRLGSTIVALGNAGASTEKDIAMMGLRIAAAGNYVGMSEAQILGFANALSSVGIEAEAGGSSISTVIKIINSAVSSGGGKLAEFAKVSGLSGGEFAKSWKRDASVALTGWIEGLSRLKKEGKDVPAVLSELDPKLRGIRVQDTLLRAAGAGALLRESLGLGVKAWKENNALTEEAQKRYKTVASRLQILKNKVIDAGVSLGQELLPPLIDFVEFAGPKVGAIAEAFGALPGPVKATALGLLILTGPVASGLGYFASGVGRALVLVNKLAIAGKGLAIFNTAMMAGQGFGPSLGMAFQGGGTAAAASVAKGFALSLAPAIAAYGIGNIVTSVLNKDWRDVGFEAGGAVAGGIAGFLIGGPLGAMIGVGVGSLAGELLSGLTAGSKLTQLQAKYQAQTRLAASATDVQAKAVKHLTGTEGRWHRAQGAHRRAVREATSARRHFTRALASSGVETLAATEAELGLARANRKEMRTAQAAANAHRMHGNALKLYNQRTVHLYAAEKQRLPTLRRLVASMNKRLNKEPHNIKLLERTVKKERELGGVQRTLKKLVEESATKSGPKLARTLRNMNTQQAQYGTKGRVLVDRLSEQRDRMRQLTETGQKATPMWQSLRKEIGKTTRALERFTEQTEGLAPPVIQPGEGGGPHHRRGPQMQVPRRRGRGAGRAGTSSIPRSRGPRSQAGNLELKGLFRRDTTIVVPVELDGKTIAQSTARHTEDEAAVA